MSVTDHPAWFYQQNDITDPTPYEEDNGILDGMECPICGEGFRRGEDILELGHWCLGHDRFLVHADCVRGIRNSDYENTVRIMAIFGFDVQQIDSEEET